jgi:hypothetical protein
MYILYIVQYVLLKPFIKVEVLHATPLFWYLCVFTLRIIKLFSTKICLSYENMFELLF